MPFLLDNFYVSLRYVLEAMLYRPLVLQQLDEQHPLLRLYGQAYQRDHEGHHHSTGADDISTISERYTSMDSGLIMDQAWFYTRNELW